MSWFSELAGKAEAFLERVDQATATTIQNAQTPSRDETASSNDDIDAHIGELHKNNSPNRGDVRLESTKSHSVSDLQSMVQTQPKPPKDLARVGHVTPVKYFTPGASKQRSTPPTNSAALSNDSWVEYLNSPSKKQASEKAASTKGVTIVKEKHDKELDKPVSEVATDTSNKEIPDVTVTGEYVIIYNVSISNNCDYKNTVVPVYVIVNCFLI